MCRADSSKHRLQCVARCFSGARQQQQLHRILHWHAAAGPTVQCGPRLPRAAVHVPAHSLASGTGMQACCTCINLSHNSLYMWDDACCMCMLEPVSQTSGLAARSRQLIPKLQCSDWQATICMDLTPAAVCLQLRQLQPDALGVPAIHKLQCHLWRGQGLSQRGLHSACQQPRQQQQLGGGHSKCLWAPAPDRAPAAAVQHSPLRSSHLGSRGLGQLQCTLRR